MKGGSEYKKRLWTEEEDRILMDFVRVHGKGKWNRVAKMTGLKRCGKSCRMRWINYLSPSVKRGNFSEEEDDLIIRLHGLLGNRWSLIAGRVPGRTDNQVKNHWNTHLSKKLGFKNGKPRSGIASSKSGEVERSPSMRPSPSSEEPSSPDGTTGDTNPSATHGGSREAARSDLGTRVVAMDGSACDHMSSFLPFVYEDMNLYALNNVTEFTDYCDLDIIWHGL